MNVPRQSTSRMIETCDRSNDIFQSQGPFPTCKRNRPIVTEQERETEMERGRGGERRRCFGGVPR